jgi:hypothetical protein
MALRPPVTQVYHFPGKILFQLIDLMQLFELEKIHEAFLIHFTLSE